MGLCVPVVVVVVLAVVALFLVTARGALLFAVANHSHADSKEDREEGQEDDPEHVAAIQLVDAADQRAIPSLVLFFLQIAEILAGSLAAQHLC